MKIMVTMLMMSGRQIRELAPCFETAIKPHCSLICVHYYGQKTNILYKIPKKTQCLKPHFLKPHAYNLERRTKVKGEHRGLFYVYFSFAT